MIIILDEILKIVNKFIPDKNSQYELERELRKLDIAELETKGTFIDKLSRAMPLIPMILPSFLAVLLAMFTINYLMDIIYTVMGAEAPIIHIDDRLVEFCKWFMGFLMGKKTIEKFSKWYNKEYYDSRFKYV